MTVARFGGARPVCRAGYTHTHHTIRIDRVHHNTTRAGRRDELGRTGRRGSWRAGVGTRRGAPCPSRDERGPLPRRESAVPLGPRSRRRDHPQSLEPLAVRAEVRGRRALEAAPFVIFVPKRSHKRRVFSVRRFGFAFALRRRGVIRACSCCHKR